MPAVSVLPPVHLQTRMIDSHSEVAGVVVGPEHVVDVEDDRLPGHVQYGGFLYFLGCEEEDIIMFLRETEQSEIVTLFCRGTEWQLAGAVHHILSSYCRLYLLAILYSRLHGVLSENHYQTHYQCLISSIACSLV